MTKIFITDDHFLIREGLKKILKDERDYELVGEAANGNETLQKLQKTKCDILILDFSLPDISGLDVLKDVKDRFPKMKVLMLSMFPEERFGLRTIKAGADGYLTKDSVPNELVNALRKLVAGRKFITETLAQTMAEESDSHNKKMPHETLSDREFEIFLLLGEGKSVTTISEKLFLSISTVNTHRTRLLEKMNLKTTAELIRYAMEHKLVE